MFDLPVHLMPLAPLAFGASGSSSTQFLLQQIVLGLALGSVYALIALGYTMVYGVLRLINFAHGDVFMLGSYISFFVLQSVVTANHAAPSWGLAAGVLIVSMLGCGVIGVIIERLAYRPVRRAPRLTPLITAIGVSIFLENFVNLKWVFGSAAQFAATAIPNDIMKFTLGGVEIQRNSLILFVATLLLLGLLRYLVVYTKMGKAMRAVSFDRDAASLMGINVDRVISFTFFVGSALAGAGAFLFVVLTHNRIEPTMGVLPGLKAFVAAVLGGIGNIPGAALGGFIMGIAEQLTSGYLTNLNNPNFPPGYANAVSFLILIVILLLRPSGLLGKGVAEKV